MPRRPLLRLAAGVALIVALSGCAGRSLDGQQQLASQRECVSLIERNLSNNAKASITIDGQKLSLGADLYRKIQELRPRGVFNLDEPKVQQYGPHTQISDLCKDGSKRSTPAASTTSTTAATTTTTTVVPGG